MIFYLLHFAVLCVLISLEVYVNRHSRNSETELNNFAISLLFGIIEAVLYLVILLFNETWLPALIQQVMKLVLCFDAIFMCSISFSFIATGSKKHEKLRTAINIVFDIVAVVIVYSQFTYINISHGGFAVESPYLFIREVRKFFPWKWWDLYRVIFRVIVPLSCYLIMTMLQERKATQLEKFQSVILGVGILSFWFSNYILSVLSKADFRFTLIFMVSYTFMATIMVSAWSKQNVPSGKGFWFTILKYIISYIAPAIIVGLVCMEFQPVGRNNTILYIALITIISIVSIVWSLFVSELLPLASTHYEADYERSLEKEFASIEYAEGEMDQITNQVFEIVQKNVECSFMNVYILGNQGQFDVAYSSNNSGKKIPYSSDAFDSLLGLNRSVLISSQLEKEHDLLGVKDLFASFFEKTNSDALFVLNEGHNVFGLITLGKKSNGDHFKEYDFNVFEKLYSYFFVFGYYMRNIANKDILGTVNREIRMSSQVISSIQENLDRINNPKIDIGYLMEAAHNIGGEFIDFIRLTDSKYLFVVGDLSGKGIAASMNMVILKFIIRTYLADTHDFKQLVVKVNNFVRENLRKGTIFAGLFALMDFEKDTLYYINCGIPALLLYTQVYNNVIEIQGSGYVLGFVKDISPYISVKSTKINKGDILLACTDGLINSHSLRGETFGKERIKQAMLENSGYPAQRMAQFTLENLEKFVSKELEDDVSILVIKYDTDDIQEAVSEDTVAEVQNDEDEIIHEEQIEEPVVDESSDVEQEAPAEDLTIFTEVIDDNPIDESVFDAPPESGALVQENETVKNDNENLSAADLNELDDLLNDVGL